MKAQLTIDLKSYWHAGGGRDAGSVYDAVVQRDPDGLPVLPGRHLKGLLRDAFARAESWGWEHFEGLADTLFGHKPENSAAPSRGCLRISDGMLPEAQRRWLASKEGEKLRPALYAGLYATAVKHETGTALDNSLRGIEVAIPVKLQAAIEPVPGQTPPDDWAERIREILPLIDAVGAHRSRGLGRAELTLEEVQP